MVMLASHFLNIRPWEWDLLLMRDVAGVVVQCEQIESEHSRARS